jgi:ferritin-like metal-binding protein YciE
MGSDHEQQLVEALADAHAMEKQSLTTLQAAVKVAGDPQLEAL